MYYLQKILTALWQLFGGTVTIPEIDATPLDPREKIHDTPRKAALTKIIYYKKGQKLL